MKEVYVNKLTAGDLPPAVRVFFECVKETDSKLVALLSALTCYCGLAPRLRTHYMYDHPGKLSMPLVNLLVVGDSGVGKNIVDFVAGMLLPSMIAHDAAERRKAREYKAKPKSKGESASNNDEPLLAIRYLQKFTLPVGVKYCDLANRKYGDWMPFFLFGSEMGAFVENKKGSSEFQAAARTAYTIGELYSRDTNYSEGYNAIVDIRWCSIICGQDPALKKYITKEGVVLGDAGRQILVKFETRLGEDRSVVRQFSAADEALVMTTVSQLMHDTYTDDDMLQPTHFVDMAWLERDVKRWCDQSRDQVVRTGSRAMNSFYVRASASAHRLATMLFYLWGEKEENKRQVRRCYYYFAQFILDGQMKQWGKIYEEEVRSDEPPAEKKPTLFDSMPKQFTRDMLVEKLLKEGMSTPARIFICQWQKRKWIYEVSKDLYEKIF